MFEWPIWTCALVLAYAIGLLLSILAVSLCTYDDIQEFKRGHWISAVVTFVACSAIVNGIVLASSTSIYPHTHYGTAREAAVHYGLHSGTAYPVQLGTRILGTEGSQSGDFGGGFFLGTGSASGVLHGQEEPGSSLSIGFTTHSRSYILELPMSTVTFVQSTASQPSVRLYLKRATDRQVQYQPYGWQSCAFKVRALVTICVKAHRHYRTVYPNNGLAPIVSKYIRNAVITLTPAMYQQVLGTP